MTNTKRESGSRAAGILLHPSSLPGRHGIGDLGSAARNWLDWLAQADCGLWQVLPLGPTGYGDSPYQSLSAFAGNPLLISLDDLQADGLLEAVDLQDYPSLPAEAVAYGAVIAAKTPLLVKAAQRFLEQAHGAERSAYEAFCEARADWLPDYALFVALKAFHQERAWIDWEPRFALRDSKALHEARERFQPQIEQCQVWQFLFDRQWKVLLSQAHDLGIQLIGDAPIFVAHDSADVWSKPELFLLDEKGQPEVEAGVPPDYFSATGQLWGNPHYRWDLMRKQGYAWWIARMRALLAWIDVVRLDHFRGFEAYWEVPGGAENAVDGRWTPGPGANLLLKLESALGGLPLIAEDLGVITPEVEALRDQFGLPGMKVMQFGFEGEDKFLPHNHAQNFFVYTGTHDNDTTRGWYERVDEEVRDFFRRYLAADGVQPGWDLIRAGWRSVANWALAPMQDVLDLGNEARMNYPGRPQGNWGWRLQAHQLTNENCDRLRELNMLYDRLRHPAVDDEV